MKKQMVIDGDTGELYTPQDNDQTKQQRRRRVKHIKKCVELDRIRLEKVRGDIFAINLSLGRKQRKELDLLARIAQSNARINELEKR